MIELKSDEYIIKNILKKSNAAFWKDLEIGDRFYITNYINQDGISSNHVYYTIHKLNDVGCMSVTVSQGNLINKLKNFEIVS